MELQKWPYLVISRLKLRHFKQRKILHVKWLERTPASCC